MSEEAVSMVIVKMLPTGSVAVASVMGLPLQEWTYVVAILVGVSQILHTLYNIYTKWAGTQKQDGQ
jgi:hypothetical protein